MKIPIQFATEERWGADLNIKTTPIRFERDYFDSRSRKRSKKHLKKNVLRMACRTSTI
jgi:hypothetical protein